MNDSWPPWFSMRYIFTLKKLFRHLKIKKWFNTTRWFERDVQNLTFFTYVTEERWSLEINKRRKIEFESKSYILNCIPNISVVSERCLFQSVVGGSVSKHMCTSFERWGFGGGGHEFLRSTIFMHLNLRTISRQPKLDACGPETQYAGRERVSGDSGISDRLNERVLLCRDNCAKNGGKEHLVSLVFYDDVVKRRSSRGCVRKLYITNKKIKKKLNFHRRFFGKKKNETK